MSDIEDLRSEAEELGEHLLAHLLKTALAIAKRATGPSLVTRSRHCR
ncbi:hypothetical protein [Microbaculum marinum]|uniref:Uncharacterized protein n=1 Tax=Microbaculum marinum TaxID=1764581 RepID=A0AAW9RPH2_9HYPH